MYGTVASTLSTARFVLFDEASAASVVLAFRTPCDHSLYVLVEGESFSLAVAE
jgi:hypothetical protein